MGREVGETGERRGEGLRPGKGERAGKRGSEAEGRGPEQGGIEPTGKKKGNWG